jgi:hypothetical protein
MDGLPPPGKQGRSKVSKCLIAVAPLTTTIRNIPTEVVGKSRQPLSPRGDKPDPCRTDRRWGHGKTLSVNRDSCAVADFVVAR